MNGNEKTLICHKNLLEIGFVFAPAASEVPLMYRSENLIKIREPR